VEKAIEQYEQALAIAREIGHRQGEGNHLGNLGTAYSALGQVEKAIEQYEQALAIAREIGYRQNEGNWLGNLGSAYFDLKQYERADEFYRQQQKICQEIGYRYGEANALWGRAICTNKFGSQAQAIKFAQLALEIFTAIKSPSAETMKNIISGWQKN
jgi:tetratricopeptide (TPR) repeat protein